MIPEGWTLTTLGEACKGKIQTGLFGSQLHSYEYVEVAKVLNVKKNPLKIAQNILNFGRKIKVYLFDRDYKFISQDCQRYLDCQKTIIPY